MDTHEKIYCRICGNTFKQISTGHAKMHGMTVAEYREQFPDAPIVAPIIKENKSKSMKEYVKSQEIIDKYRNRAKNFWSKKENRERMCESFKQRPKQTDEVVQQISATMKQRYAEGSALKKLNESDNMRNRINPFAKLGRHKQLSSTEEFADTLLKPYGFEHNYAVPSIESLKGNFYIDFALPKCKIAIELDSEVHDKEDVVECDIRKNQGLTKLGWTVFRVKFNSRSARRFVKVNEELLSIIKRFNLEIVNED